MNMEQSSCNDLNCNINGWEVFGAIPHYATLRVFSTTFLERVSFFAFTTPDRKSVV